MPYGLPYDSPGIIPGIILLVSRILTLLRYAATVCQKGLQQKDVAVSEESSGSPHPCVRSQGQNSLFQLDEITHRDLPQLNIVGEPERTPPIATKEPTVKTSKRMGKVYLTTPSKVAQKCLNWPTLQMIMSKYQQDPHMTEICNPEDQQVMSIPEYLAAVCHGKIPKGPNHDQIKKLSKLPGNHRGTKVIVLTYSRIMSRAAKDRKPPKST